MKKNVFVFIVATIFCLSIHAQEVLRVQNGATLTIQNGAQLTVMGTVTLEDGSRFINNGKLTLRRNSTGGVADFIDNTSTVYSYGSGAVVFNSGGTQKIVSRNNFGEIDVNTQNLNLTSNTTASKWLMVRGKVNTGSFIAIVSGAAELSLDADPANSDFSIGWINGNLRRYVVPFKFARYIFPVGNSTHSNVALMDNVNVNPLNNVGYIDASFAPKPGSDSGLNVSEGSARYTSVSNGGVWFLNPNVQPTSGNFDLVLFFNGFIDLTDNGFAELQRPIASSNAADWSVPVGSSLPPVGDPGRTLASGFARRNGISTLSQFGIGLFNLKTFPIDFSVKRISEENVQLSFDQIADQENNQFIVERRLDNEPFFSSVGLVTLRGSDPVSGTGADIYFIDPNKYPGTSYYRLRRVHRSDHETEGIVKSVSGFSGPNLSVSLYPNPNNGQFNLRVAGNERMYKVLVTDESGKFVRELDVVSNAKVIVSGLSSGTYIVQVPARGNEKAFTQKVVVVQ